VREYIHYLHPLPVPLGSDSSQLAGGQEPVALPLEPDLPYIVIDLVPVWVLQQTTFVGPRPELQKMEYT
jgi:hypothetical protein